MKKQELGIYIHIPFCKQKCYYCDFVSFPNQCDKEAEYIDAVKKEIEIYDLDKYDVTTIYIGGGTPSYIDSKYIKEILLNIKDKLKGNSTPWEAIEITIEVNPGTINQAKLEDYKNTGVNRLSIGLQSTKDHLLKEIGRIHTKQDFLETYNLAKKVGFENINVDLMLGLPNQSIQDLKESLQEIIELSPNHISVYSLIVEEETPIAKFLEEGKLELPEEELERQMYWYVKNTLELAGYTHYEISNFAKKGKESKHNLNCWEQKEYIGIGTAAHSYKNKIRYSNANQLGTYIENMKKLKDIDGELEKEQSDIYDKQEVQTIEETKKEYMLLGLRKIQGVDISKFKEKFVDNPIFLYKDELSKLVEEGLIQVDLNEIKLTNKGLDLANLVFEEFV